jgi:S1-C subfamily serine protease
VVFDQDDHSFHDRELIEEINRKYEQGEEEPLDSGRRRAASLAVKAVALLLACVFLFTVTGRWLAVFSGPSITFLRESWTLSSDPMVIELRKAVARISVENRPGSSDGSLQGSGFNLSPSGLIVTNRHLVENAAVVRVSFPGEGTFTAREWSVSNQSDLAFIILDSEGLPALELSLDPLQPGAEILVIGNPLQFARVANRGKLAGYIESGTGYPNLLIEAMVYPGSSGSPVFNLSGDVVGVVFAVLRTNEPSEALGLAVSSFELVRFLQAEDMVQ